MRQEASLARTREFSSTRLTRGCFLSRAYDKLKVEQDASLSYLYSSRARRILFGRDAVALFKVQAGLLVPLRQREMRVRLLSPTSVEFSSQATDPIQVSLRASLADGELEGYSRRVGVVNRSTAALRIRTITMSDPSSLNFRKEGDPPGEVGMNAFNRGDHVVMDDVGDTAGARVIGFSPRPNAIYMTREKQKAIDLLASGELPGNTAGVSGALLTLAQQEAEIPPGGSAEFAAGALYNESSLAAALSEFPSVLSGAGVLASGIERTSAADQSPHHGDGAVFRCSDQALDFAFAWATAALYSFESEEDPLERLSAGLGLAVLRPNLFQREFELRRAEQRKDGFLPLGDSAEPGPLETALFIINACSFLRLSGDKKLAKKWYPALRKAGEALRASSRTSGLVETHSKRPTGWRRLLESGFPTGITSESNLLAARALADVAASAYGIGKGSDSAAFSDSNIRIVSEVGKHLRDEKTGGLALNIDPRGRVHSELTVDQAISLSYCPFDRNLASSLVHRLLESDFESGYGPRCVPTSNLLYYHPLYGEGQIGSCWTRGTLSHAILAYSAGYPNVGWLQLEKVVRLVYSDWEKLGGVPGEFPYWFAEPERRVMGGKGSDIVSAARLVETVLFGEMGITLEGGSLALKPAVSSHLRWASLFGFGAEDIAFFVGRSSGKMALLASTHSRGVEGSLSFDRCLRIATGSPLETLVFSNDAEVLVCIGCPEVAPSVPPSLSLDLPLERGPLAKSLFMDLLELDQSSLSWKKREPVRVSARLELPVQLEGGAWTALRLTPAGGGSQDLRRSSLQRHDATRDNHKTS